MADSPYDPISLGRWDPFRRTPSVSFRNGKIAFLPGPGTKREFNIKETSFLSGARLEYRIKKEDMFFDGDHSQSVSRSLWVIAPDGTRSLLADGFILYMSLTVAAKNLGRRKIPFRAVSFYEGERGQMVEKEIKIPRSGAWFTTALILVFSDLWLGAIAGAFIRNVNEIIAVGVFAFVVIAIITLRSAASKRAASVSLVLRLFTYGAGYSVSVVFVRFLLGGVRGR